MRAKLAASSSAKSRRGWSTPPQARARAVARLRRERRRAEKSGRQRSASSAGATRYNVPPRARRRSRSTALADDSVAEATRSSVQSEREERAVEAIEPASRSGVL